MIKLYEIPDEFFVGKKLECYICHTKSLQGAINDISELYNVSDLKYERFFESLPACDLDTRPVVGFDRYGRVQRCPSCGHCSLNISETGSNLKKIIRTETYLNQLTNPDYPERVNSFLCKAIIDQEHGDYRSATWSSIYAAWNCDDLHYSIQASLCRRKAADTLLIAVQNGQTIYAGRACIQTRLLKGSENMEQARQAMNMVILIDLLRRSGQAEKARELITEQLGNARGFFREIIMYQNVLIQNGDLDAHKIPPSIFLLLKNKFELRPIKEIPIYHISSQIDRKFALRPREKTQRVRYPYKEFRECLYFLDSDNIEDRIAALKHLGQLRYRRISLLSKLLQDDHELIRLLAVWAIGRSAKCSAVKYLCTALKDESCNVRFFAAKALGKFNDDRSIRALKRALNDKNDHVRLQSLRSLAINIGYKEADVYRRYEKREKNKDLKNAVVVVLGLLRSNPAILIPSIIDIMRKEKYKQVAQESEYWCESDSKGQYNVRSKRFNLLDYNTSRTIVREYFESLTEMQDEFGAEEEEKIHEEEYIYEEIDPEDDLEIEENTEEYSEETICSASIEQDGYQMYLDSHIHDLARIDDEKQFDLLETCSSILIGYDYDALNPLLDVFEDKEDILRSEAVKIIWEIAHDKREAQEFLFRALRDENVDVRAMALNIASTLEYDQVIERLLDFLDDSSEEDYKQQVLPVLINFGKPVIVPLLNRLIKTKQQIPSTITNVENLWDDETDVPM